jgi:hypothetical protein
VNFNVLLSCVALDNNTGIRDGNETAIGHACGKPTPNIYENIYADNMKSFWIRKLQDISIKLTGNQRRQKL